MDKISKKGVPLLTAGRAVRYKGKMRFKIIRIFTCFMLCIYMLSSVPVNALGTIQGSALKLDEVHADSSLSFTPKAPLPAQKDPCLSLLHSARLSPGAQGRDHHNLGPSRTSIGYFASDAPDKKTASVALGIFLGVRVALGPKEVVQDNKRVQFSSEIRSTRAGGHNHALAIASYRACKNNQALKSQ